jgi:hypothetical protein
MCSRVVWFIGTIFSNKPVASIFRLDRGGRFLRDVDFLRNCMTLYRISGSHGLEFEEFYL